MPATGHTNARSKHNPRRPPSSSTTITLDLHGYQKEAAVERLTAFLEAHRTAGTTQVCIVTGSGSHSGTTGPVLRTAVEKLLQRRQIQFTRNSPGSFLVHPATGHVWYHRQGSEEDTKVIVRDGVEDEIRMQQSAARQRRRQGTIIATGTSTRQFDRGYATGIDSGPSLKEVARADAELDRAREESLELTRHQTKQVNQEVRELVQAKNASIQEVERLQEQDEKRLREAFARSNRIDEMTHEEEERMLQQALESSQQELATDKELEQALQEALSQSLAENAAFTSGGENHHEEEERMIQQAIAMSLLCD